MMLKYYLCAFFFSSVIVDIFGDDSFLAKFHQHEFKLKEIRMELKWFNSDIYYDFRIVTFKYNRSCAVTNMTIHPKIDIDGKKLETVVQAFKFASNEYRVFPIRFQVNSWKGLNSNLGGLKSMFNCGNVHLEPFHFLKNVTYHTCNIQMDATQLPPLIPSGRFMVEFTQVMDEQKFFTFRSYAEVYRDLIIRE